VFTHLGGGSKEHTLEGVYSVQIKISARHGHLSDETQAKIKEKLEKLPRYYDRLSSIDATVDLEHRDAPDVDLRVSADHKHDFVAVCHSTELMAAVDEVVEKMEQQLLKYKTKVQDRHRGPGHRQVGETLPPENPADEAAPADTESGI
jgi:putative sigma-54 modulation protein